MNSTEQVATVKAAMEEGRKPKGIIIRYANEWGISGRTVVRRMKEAKKVILAEGERKKEIYEKVRDQHFEEAAKKEMLSLEEADAYLAGIVSGIATAKKVVNSKDGVKIMEVPVDPATRLRALALLYKRRGAFPRMKTKEEEEDDGKELITGFCFNSPDEDYNDPFDRNKSKNNKEELVEQPERNAPMAAEEVNPAENTDREDHFAPVDTPAPKPTTNPSYTINPVNGEKIRTKAVYPPPPFFPYKHGYKPPYRRGEDKGYVHFKLKKRR